MIKLNKPSKIARVVKQKNDDWYIVWYANNVRFRVKYGLNRIKDLELRQRWADRIIDFINEELLFGREVTDKDVPAAFVPTPHLDAPVFLAVKAEPKEESKIVVADSMTVFAYFDQFIDIKTKEGASKGWIKKFRSLLNGLRAFAADEQKTDYRFEELDRDWALRYRQWCCAPPREHGSNHLAKNLQTLRQVLRDAQFESDIVVNSKYNSRTFRVKGVITDQISLSLIDLHRMAELDLTDLPGREIVRDGFLIGCFTGLRFGNWKLMPENIVEVREGATTRKMLRVTTLKTHDTVLIPLHKIAYDILKRHGFRLPELSNAKTNKYLKEIAKLAGLKKPMLLKKSRGGKVVIESKKQWEEVKTHTARRTFVTIALFDLKIPSQYVMKITGHKTEKQLLEYARIGGEVAALEVARAMDDFFKT